MDREGVHPCIRRVFLLVGSDLVSQTKVKIYHLFVLGVIPPHRGKYMAGREEVLLYRSLPGGIAHRRHKDGMHVLRKI